MNDKFDKLYVEIQNFTNINNGAKALLSILISLSKQKGYAFPTNKYLADRQNCKPRMINYRLAKLAELGYIDIIPGKIRRIQINKKYQHLINITSSKENDDKACLYETESNRQKAGRKRARENYQRIEELEKQLAEKDDIIVVQEQQMESMKKTIRQLKTSKRITNTNISKGNLKLIKK